MKACNVVMFFANRFSLFIRGSLSTPRALTPFRVGTFMGFTSSFHNKINLSIPVTGTYFLRQACATYNEYE